MNETLQISGEGQVPAHAGDDGADRVDVIEDLQGFAALKPAWTALHARDPSAGVFLSWDWLNALFADNPGSWRVLALRDSAASGGYSAFLPLRHTLRWSGSNRQFQSHLAAAGRLGFSEYVGFVCAPEHEAAAIPALARHLAAEPWMRFSIRYEPTRRRLELFAAAFDATRFTVTWPDYTINEGRTNQLVSPRVALPDSYDGWLQMISARKRKKIRRAFRKDIESGRLRILGTAPERFEADAAQLIEYWREKWEGDKRDSQVRITARKYADLLQQSQDLGLLYMPSLWDGDRMLGAIAHVIDPYTRGVCSMVEGRAADVEDVEVGLLLHSHAIRSAIEAELSCYDFGHGDEPYKYSYGAEDHPVGYLVIERVEPDPVQVLDRGFLGDALARTRRYVETGRTKRAISALDQLARIAG